MGFAEFPGYSFWHSLLLQRQKSDRYGFATVFDEL